MSKAPEVLNKLASEESRAERTVNDLKIETSILRNEPDQVKSFIESINANKNVFVQGPNMLINQDKIFENHQNLTKNSFELLNENGKTSSSKDATTVNNNVTGTETSATVKVNLNADTFYVVKPRTRKRPAINQSVTETEKNTPQQSEIIRSPITKKSKNLR